MKIFTRLVVQATVIFHVCYSALEKESSELATSDNHQELPVSYPNPLDFSAVAKNEPLILDPSRDYKTAFPTRNKENQLEFHQHHLAYACPPDKKKHAEFLKLDKDYQNNLFLMKVDPSIPWNEVTCDQEVIPRLIPRDTIDCGPNLLVREIGFMVNKWNRLYWKPLRCIDFIINQVDSLAKTDGFYWLDKIRICESEKDNRIIHLSHIIPSPTTLLLDEKDSEFKMSKYSSSDINVDFSFYNVDKQLDILHPLLENSSLYDQEHDYFIPQQRIQHQDMQMENWKKVTYFDFNYVPMWKSVAEGNWKEVNNRIRKVAKCNHEQSILIYSGTYDILKINGNPVVLHPEHPKFATVPLFFWKVIYHLHGEYGLAIITLNDIYVDDPKNHEYEICNVRQDCCPMFENTEIKQGYTYCCKVDTELKKKFNLYEIDYVAAEAPWDDAVLRRFCPRIEFPPFEEEGKGKEEGVEGSD